MPLARTFDAIRGKTIITVHSGYAVRLSRWSDIQEYLPFLHDMAKSYDKVRILELGTRKGNSTLAFLAAAKEVGGHVWSVDIDNVTRDLDGMFSWRSLPYWTFIHGDDMNPDTISQLPVEVDILFVDANHEYEYVLNELHMYMPRVAPGGVALFHDTKLRSWYGYTPLSDIPPVAQALNEYCAEKRIIWEEISGEYGLGIIKV